MKEFNLSKWRQFIIEEAVVADGNFGNDIEDRYAYIRPLMADLPDTARTETLIDGMEDGLREDDKELFDFYFVEAMKALGLEHQLMDDGGIEGPGIEDLTPDSALGPNPSFVEEAEGEETDYMKRRRKMSDYYVDNEAEEIDAEDLDASADYFDSLAEEKEKLDEVAAELVGQYGAEAVNGLYMLAGILGLPIAAVLASVASGDIDVDLKGTLKDLYKSTGDSVKSKAKSLAKALGLGSGSPAMGEGKKTLAENANDLPEIQKHNKMMTKAVDFFLAKAEEYGVDGKLIGDFNLGRNKFIEELFRKRKEKYPDQYSEGKKTNDDVLDEIIEGGGFKVGDFVYLRNDPKKSPMEVVDIRKMFGKNLQAVSVVTIPDGEKIEFDQSQLKKLPSAEEKANVFVR